MEIFNYVMVLASIIIGLALAHLLQGLARIVQHPERPHTYWVHLVWVAIMLETSMFWWWWEFRLSSTPVWTFGLYIFVLSFAVVIYLIAAMLFPEDLEGYSGFKDYFYSRRKWFFGLNLLFVGLDMTDTLLKGAAHFASLGWQYPASTGTQCVLFIAAIASRDEKLHAFIAVALLADRTAIALQSFQTVQ